MGSFISQVVVHPDGVDPHDPRQLVNSRSFCVTVNWRGEDTYDVQQGFGTERPLSRAGNGGMILPFQRRQYRFDFDEPVEWAHKVVNDVQVDGMTFPQWQEAFTRRRAAAANPGARPLPPPPPQGPLLI